MKKTGVILAAVATVIAGVYVTSQGLAQGQIQQTGATSVGAQRTKVALINLMAVIRNYNKYKNATANIKREFENAQQVMKTKRAAILEKQGQVQSPTLTPEQKEEVVRQLKAMERDYQDAADDLKQRLEKEQVDLLVQIYHEIEDAVRRYAVNYDLDLIVQYSDAPPEEANNSAVIARRALNAACMPIYIAQGLDITTAVTNILNQNLSAAGAPTNGVAQPANAYPAH